MKKKRIAIRVPNWIGDAVLSTPLLLIIREYFPGSEIYLIMRKKVKDVFLNNKNYNKIVILDDKKKGVLKSGIFLRKYNFDIYFNLPESLSSLVICFLSSAKIRLGYGTFLAGLFLNNSLKSPGPEIHRALKYIHLLDYFLDKYRNSSTDILTQLHKKKVESAVFLTKKETNRGKEILKKYKNHKKFIGINPNSSAVSRRWLKMRFSQLSDILIKKYKVNVVFFGSASEREYVKSIINQMKENPINLAGEINLREYMAILKSIDLFITNDSGPMHLANAVGTDVIALEGPADIKETGMLNTKSRRIYINKGFPCSPCVKNKCPKNNECMKAITVQDVLKEIKKIMEFWNEKD